MRKTTRAIYFSSASAFRAWLDANHGSAQELLVGFWKSASGKPSLTWSESVDEAICFGWIDGIRRSVDADRYTIRFTPRKPGSNWSQVNIAKVAKLEKEGRMRPAGREAFGAAPERPPQRYSYEQRARAKLEPGQLEAFRAKRRAWEFFEAQAPSYQRLAVYWVASAKKEETRARRFAELVAASAAGRRPRSLQMTGGKAAQARGD